MKNAIAATAAALAISASGAAIAADMGVGVVTTDEPVMMTDPGFDWDGMYVGLRGAGTQYYGGGDPGLAEVGFVLGANGTVDDILFGVEGWVGGYQVAGIVTDFQVGAEGRIGYLVTPDVALYGSSTVESYFNAEGPGNHLVALGVGAGVEFAMTDNLSADFGYTYFGWNNIDMDVTGHQISASLNYHF